MTWKLNVSKKMTKNSIKPYWTDFKWLWTSSLKYKLDNCSFIRDLTEGLWIFSTRTCSKNKKKKLKYSMIAHLLKNTYSQSVTVYCSVQNILNLLGHSNVLSLCFFRCCSFENLSNKYHYRQFIVQGKSPSIGTRTKFKLRSCYMYSIM